MSSYSTDGIQSQVSLKLSAAGAIQLFLDENGELLKKFSG